MYKYLCDNVLKSNYDRKNLSYIIGNPKDFIKNWVKWNN